MSAVHVIHENHEWSQPLFDALQVQGTAYADWHMGEGLLDLSSTPPAGIYYNRMSASSHTRGHRYSPEYTAAVLNWLESYGSRVINSEQALRLEVSKVAQHRALEACGVRTPTTFAALGRDAIIAAAGRFNGEFITKHNRAGKGLGVKLFQDVDAATAYVDGADFEPSVDGITLVQQYIKAPTAHITRVEFVGGKLMYAVRVDTSEGFELCPADVCEVGDAFCPTSESSGEKFEIIDGFEHELVPRFEALLAAHQIDVAAFEFIVDEQGQAYTYDINTNTNYNTQAEGRAGASGMRTLAAYLGAELHSAVVSGERVAA
ncbi:MAG: hypothetical protein ACI9DC_000696 [Gammaproteobacteria bacterium]|jgi:hypothetical protein